MSVPVLHTFIVGEVATASNVNNDTVTLGNFLLTPPLCVARQTVTQTIGTGLTGITMDAEDIDRDNGHSTVTNTSRYTAQTPGWYHMDGQIVWAQNVNGDRDISLVVNNTSQQGFASLPPGGLQVIGLCCSGVFFLNGTTDFVEVQGRSPAGATPTSTTNGGSRFSIHYVSAT